MTLDEFLISTKQRPSALAAKAGVAASMLTRLLRGERSLSAEAAVKIAAATDGQVSVPEILASAGSRRPEEAAS